MVAANEVSSAVLQDNEVPVTGDFSAASMPGPYRLDSSTGHLLRRALQRHQALFQECASGTGLTPPQFAALTKLAELRRVTQNRLGRLVAMDPATAQGVMKRLALRGLLRTIDSTATSWNVEDPDSLAATRTALEAAGRTA